MTGPNIGDRVSEYVLVAPLGAGSFGRVFKAVHHIWKDRAVAVKIPTNPQYVANLRQEGVAVHGLEHPNIVRALGLDPFADPPYLIMEFVDGCSLREVISRHATGLPIAAIRGVMLGLLAGLDHAHTSGMIHRDIKPENILIAGGQDASTDTIEPRDVKISDFGLGRALQVTAHSIMQSGSILAEPGKSISGTLAYMSPEQRDGAGDDPRTDLYSAGVVLFEIATGERPSGTETPSMIRADLPAWIDEVFTRLYARRDRRFSTAREVLDAIETGATPPVARTAPAAGRSAGAACPACNAPTESDDNFCMHCGRQLVGQPRRCAQCDAWLENDDHYCIFCGTLAKAAAN